MAAITISTAMADQGSQRHPQRRQLIRTATAATLFRTAINRQSVDRIAMAAMTNKTAMAERDREVDSVIKKYILTKLE